MEHPPLARKAVVLLSGGLDSTVALAVAQNQGYCCYALTIHYGQRHAVELSRAQQTAKVRKVCEHKLIQVDLRAFGGSILTTDEPMPEVQTEPKPGQAIPATYVPARNTIFLSLALAWAEVLRADAIFIGANSLDYSGYPDCRPEYLEAFSHLAQLATKAGVAENWKLKIEAPLLRLTKAGIVQLGTKLGVDFSLTASCYNPGPAGQPCGQCESCLIRKKGFAEAGVLDPVQ